MPSLSQLDQAVREFITENPKDVVTVVVGAGAVVVVVGGTTVALVARTALGGKVGCPFVPSMSVAPNVQASTLPGGGA